MSNILTKCEVSMIIPSRPQLKYALQVYAMLTEIYSKLASAIAYFELTLSVLFQATPDVSHVATISKSVLIIPKLVT